MRIIVVTQVVDIHDTRLGFFHGWLEEFSKRFESVEVICLYEGEHALPANVRVHSLGKEKGNSRIQYIQKFFNYVWNYRNQYDVVFVHMNQEYIVLAGLFWKLLGRKIFFWRNHPYGNMWTRIAVLFSDQVFCTADKSFTARYKKTTIMPAGVDTSIFTKNPLVHREKNSLLVFGRVAPVKRIEKAIDATALLCAKGIPVTLSIVGDWLPKDALYVEELKKRVIEAKIEPSVHFIRGIDFTKAPETYQSHEILLNFTESGSFDKTVIEALACGTKVLVSNTSMRDSLPEDSFTNGEHTDIVKQILVLIDRDQEGYSEKVKEVVDSHSLQVLIEKLYKEIQIN